jgi:hypothetical protein
MTERLVGRDLRPTRSDTPESQRPAVVIGLKADCVFRERSGSFGSGERRGGDNNGVGDVGEVGGIVIGGGMATIVGSGVGSTGGASQEERSETGSASSLMRRISTLRLTWRSSSLSGTVWFSNAKPYRFLLLPRRSFRD